MKVTSEMINMTVGVEQTATQDNLGTDFMMDMAYTQTIMSITKVSSIGGFTVAKVYILRVKK